ncbi:TraB/GumN family protein [Lacibacter sediminis]|uniref:Erythromycin esterase family protein n=1 Tax=Lacibacter sediminis TaxID=2760713 RepID=A0A7G5XLQ7_9BACT|nr:hypothetical protein [Lacibacter sediminis]QNA46410.1 hypothetical protein H4075_09630 [Lacibacter sediminis]
MQKHLTIFLIVNFFITVSFTQTALPQQEYLKKNAIVWNNRFADPEKLFDKSLLKNQLFLIGEGHGAQYNTELQFDMIRYLQKKTGLRFILLELGFLDQIYLNRYLTTGNERLLDSFFHFHPNTFYFNKQLFQFFQQLYSFNQSLPEKDKLQIITVDLDFAYRDALLFLKREALTSIPEDHKKLFMEMDPVNDTAKILISKFDEAYSFFNKNNINYKKWLGNNYENVKHLLDNIHQRLYIATSKRNDLRDSVMYQNFLYAKERYGIKQKKVIGIMGSFHVKQQDAPEDPRFATILRKLNAVNGIVSFMSVYNGGEAMLPNRNNIVGTDNKKKPFINAKITNGSLSGAVKEFNLLEPFFDSNKAYLFHLNRKATPFSQSDEFTLSEDPTLVTTIQLFQILILYNQSPATIPYKE